MRKIRITVAGIDLEAELLPTPTADCVYDAVPFDSTTNTWGEEVYFPVPVSTALQPDAKDIVKAGEIAFWVEDQCIAIGFGPTPISQAQEIRFATRTNIFARALSDVRTLKDVKDGDSIKVEVAD